MGWIRCLTLGFAIALLVGCGATINEATTIESLASAGKAGVVMHVDMGTCFNTQVYIGRQSGDVYKAAAAARSGSFLDTSPMIRAELDPGEYHIVKLICTIGNHSTVLGKGAWGSYKQSLGRFEVRAGEIVNIGSLHVVPVGGKDVHLAVSDIPETEFQQFSKDYPNIVARMQTRLLEVPVPKLAEVEMVQWCNRVTALNAAHRAHPPAACLSLQNEQVRRLEKVNPERPALWQ